MVWQRRWRNKVVETRATYAAWKAMQRRCYDKNAIGYGNYGGRGIQVCERWLLSYDDFVFDMGIRPDGLSLERKDGDKNYCPENCRWATRMEQADNRRTTSRLTYSGRTQSKAAWARELGISWNALNERLRTDPERALTRPGPKGYDL